MGDGIVGVVRVRPLVWDQDPYNCGEDWHWRASRGGYLYEVGCTEDGTWWWKEDGIVDICAITVDGDIESAKAAAQADYEARIMATLDVQPMDVKISLDTTHVRAMLDDAEKSVSHFSTIAATITVNALRHGATHAQIMDFITGKSDFVNWLHDQVKTQPVTVQDAARVPEIAALIDAVKSILEGLGNIVSSRSDIDEILYNSELEKWIYSVDDLWTNLRAIADTD